MTDDAALAELEAYRPEDGLLVEALETAWQLLAESRAAQRLARRGIEASLYVANPGTASAALRRSPYLVENLMAFTHSGVIVVNEDFIVEIECALRSFSLSAAPLQSPYLRSDGDLFGLVKRIRLDPRAYLLRMRRQAAAASNPAAQGREEETRLELALVLFFFLGHEAGHLLSAGEARAFGAYLDPDAPLERRLANAVVKLARHVDEFWRYGYDLRGFQQVADPSSPVRRAVDNLARREAVDRAAHRRWFRAESEADAVAGKTAGDHLLALAGVDREQASRHLFLLVRGLFAVALYFWYRDLLAFCEKLGVERLTDTLDLTLRMTRSRDQYVRAASLFGDVHRFTLLRGVLGIEAAMGAGSDYFDAAPKPDAVWPREVLRHASAERRLDAQRASDSINRHALLGIMMDTAVKIACVGCATGWLKQTDERLAREQILMVNFEPVDAAVRHLQRLRGGGAGG